MARVKPIGRQALRKNFDSLVEDYYRSPDKNTHVDDPEFDNKYKRTNYRIDNVSNDANVYRNIQ